MQRGRFLTLASALALTSCGRAPAGSRGGGAAAAADRRREPSFVVPRYGGGMGSLADYRGRPVLVNVWASWCTACRAEQPSLNRLHRAYAARGLVLVGIDEGEDATAVARFLKEFGVTYPILLDSDQRYGQALGAVGIPTSAFIRRDGTILSLVDGEMKYEQMVRHVESLLRSR